MEKLPSYLIKKFPPVELYLGDVDAIHTILREVDPNSTLKTFDYKFVDAEDLKHLSENTIYYLKLEAHDPGNYKGLYVSVAIQPDEATIYLSEDDSVAYGIFSKLRDFLSAKTRPSTWIGPYANTFYLLGFVIFGLGFVSNLYIQYVAPQWTHCTLSTFLVMISGAVIEQAAYSSNKYRLSLIHLRSKPRPLTKKDLFHKYFNLRSFVTMAVYAVLTAIFLKVLSFLPDFWKWFQDIF
jgi:hypothetical protein